LIRMIIVLLLILEVVFGDIFNKFFVIALLLIIVLWVIVKSSSSKLKKIYKQGIIPSMVEILFEGGVYEPKMGISGEYVRKHTLLKESNHYTCKDYIEGKVGNASFGLCNIDTWGEFEAHDADGGDYRRDLLFRGVLCFAFMKRHFDTRITISPSSGGKSNGGISVDDAAFERRFAIKATDEAAVRNILTPELRKTLLAIPQEITGNLKIQIYEQLFMITIEKDKPFFEFNKKMRDIEEALRVDYAVLTTFDSIANDLNNNPYLWPETKVAH
ncbi:DUF3137 domain-containing protein, partial [Parabacteroides sp. OttesenSCG-928-J18]|nr:DUF3137 domain-containing protein [Parabacteroides sp. OttesenSCG-928-J18]